MQLPDFSMLAVMLTSELLLFSANIMGTCEHLIINILSPYIIVSNIFHILTNL